MKYLFTFLMLITYGLHAKYTEDRFINQIKLRHKNCHVEYWNKSDAKHIYLDAGIFTDNWTELHFSICGDWSRAIYYKYNLVFEGHYVGDDLCGNYAPACKCFVINGYYIPKKVIGIECSGE